MLPAAIAVRWWFGRAERREAAAGDVAPADVGEPEGAPDQPRPGASG
jgi:hypothetical protein